MPPDILLFLSLAPTQEALQWHRTSVTEADEIEQPSGVAVDEVHLHSGDDVSPVQQKSTVANKSAVHLSGQKDVQGSNVKDPGAAICGGDGLHLVVSDSDEEGPAPAPNYMRPLHSLRDKGAVEHGSPSGHLHAEGPRFFQTAAARAATSTCRTWILS